MKRIMTGSGMSGCHAMLTSQGTLSYDTEFNQNMDKAYAGYWTPDILPFRIANFHTYDDKTTTVCGYCSTDNLCNLGAGVKLYEQTNSTRFTPSRGYRVCMFENGSRNDETATIAGSVKYDPYEACKVAHDIWAHNNIHGHRSYEHQKVNGSADLAFENLTWANRGTTYVYHKWARDPCFRDNANNLYFKKDGSDDYCDPDGNPIPQGESYGFRWLGKGNIIRTSEDAPEVYFNVPDVDKPKSSIETGSFVDDTYRNSITVNHGNKKVKMGVECVISGTGLTDALTGAKNMTTYEGTNGWISIITKGLGSDIASRSQGVMRFYNFSAMKQLATDVYYLCDDEYWTIDSSCDYESGLATVNSTVMSQGFLSTPTGEDRIAIFRKKQPGETADKIYHGGTPTETYDPWREFTREPEEIGGCVKEISEHPNWNWQDPEIAATLQTIRSNPTLYGGSDANDFYSGFYAVDNYSTGNNIAIAKNGNVYDLPENTGIIAMNYHFTSVDE
jgi:hypothetical protein